MRLGTHFNRDHRHQNNWRFTMTWEAGWRYGIIYTVPYEQQKINRQIILFQRIYYLSISLTGLSCHREPSIVLMSIPWYLISKEITYSVEHSAEVGFCSNCKIISFILETLEQFECGCPFFCWQAVNRDRTITPKGHDYSITSLF